MCARPLVDEGFGRAQSRVLSWVRMRLCACRLDRLARVAMALAATAVLALATARQAHGSVSIAITWDGLLRQSQAAAVVMPLEARSVWEGGRIYTYTRVRVDRPVAGEIVQGGEAWVRTMGGVVDKVGQIVEGEAALVPGQPSLVFIHPGPVGAVEVTARGQGQFPVMTEATSARPHVVRNNAVGALLAPQVRASSPGTRLAAEVLHGRYVDDVAVEIAADWSRAHGHP
jgi:hypothetical protein